jgi:hypothetical protein
MKLSFKLYRTVTIPAMDVVAVCGAEGKTVLETEAIFRKNFYPFAPRLKAFWPESLNERAGPYDSGDSVPCRVNLLMTFGMEMLAFDVACEKIPFAGLCGCDPMDPVDVARADGALRSELERFGLSCEIDNFEWRVEYNLAGN